MDQSPLPSPLVDHQADLRDLLTPCDPLRSDSIRLRNSLTVQGAFPWVRSVSNSETRTGMVVSPEKAAWMRWSRRPERTEVSSH